ncbi:ubinuclein-1 isoform X1 [Brachionus plicatilis]|uniref:Ubinuclein-1 isoform X1 n=1 Tax=Brachionus plicatilis TaxID=10195 RepID=A0A3M7SC83_BRAPC|nr:ubinuclein-1 isoform X1 [Brachionus plicatilis]
MQMNDIQKKAPNNVTFSSLMTGKQSTGMEQLNLPIDTNKKKNQIDFPSIRFELKLERPSSDKFSEFNYNKLCLRTFKAMKRIEKKPQGDEDSSIPRLATISKKDLSIIDGVFQIEKKKVKELLATFRNKIILSKEMDREEGDESNELEDEEDTNASEIVQNSKSKKKASKGLNGVDLNKFRYADFGHLGKGYDESDSFIDNSDAQDVHIPKNLVPKRGGFYINREKLKLATIDEVKKSKKSTKMEEVSEQSGDESENSDETSGTEDSDDEESEEETSSSDDEMDEDDEESESEEEDEEIGKKCTIENELASSNSESAKATVSESFKKIKKVVEDEEEEIKTDIIRDENSDLSKNKENKIVNPMDPISINSKKRKNETQSTEFTNPVDKVQAKITHSNGDFDEMQANTFKKFKALEIKEKILTKIQKNHKFSSKTYRFNVSHNPFLTYWHLYKRALKYLMVAQSHLQNGVIDILARNADHEYELCFGQKSVGWAWHSIFGGFYEFLGVFKRKIQHQKNFFIALNLLKGERAISKQLALIGYLEILTLELDRLANEESEKVPLCLFWKQQRSLAI